MKNSLTRPTFKKDFTVFSISIFIVMLMLITLFAYHLYNSNASQIKQNIETQARQLERSFTDEVDHTAYLMDMMITQIRPNSKDLDYINNIMSKFRVTPGLKTLLSWTIFSWADTNYHITVDALYGIMDPPYDLSSRDYIAFTRSEPNQIHLGKPVYGSTSKRWMIPAGIGAVSDSGEYIGAMTIGFDIHTLTEQLRNAFTGDGFKFVLLDKELNFITSSSEQTPDMQENIDKAKERIISQNTSSTNTLQLNGFFEVCPLGRRDSYLVLPFKKYPYILYVSYNRAIASQALWESLAFRVIEVTSIGAAFFLFLILFYKRTIKPINALSDTVRTIAKGEHVSKFPRGKTFETLNLSFELLKLQRSQLAKLQHVIHREREMKDKLNNAIKIIKESDLAYEAFSNQVKNNMEKPIKSLSTTIESLMLNSIGRLIPPLSTTVEQGYLAEAYQAVLQLKTSVDTALDLEYVDIIRIIHECIVIRAKDAIHKNVRIELDYPKKLGRFYTDELKLTLMTSTPLNSRSIWFMRVLPGRRSPGPAGLHWCNCWQW
jgi:two-component system sensor histidine kinase ChiS